MHKLASHSVRVAVTLLQWIANGVPTLLGHLSHRYKYAALLGGHRETTVLPTEFPAAQLEGDVKSWGSWK
jgi:hypothetical protein